jgi:hypothetical protein
MSLSEQDLSSIRFNMADGSTLTKGTDFQSITDLSDQQRADIRAVRLQIGETTFTISRKLADDTIVDGFFYWIKEGTKTLIGSVPDRPFIAERIGFCYQGDGQSVFMRGNYALVINDAGQTEVEIGHENIVTQKVNTSLFGSLDQLPDVGTPPRVQQNGVDVNLEIPT